MNTYRQDIRSSAQYLSDSEPNYFSYGLLKHPYTDWIYFFILSVYNGEFCPLDSNPLPHCWYNALLWCYDAIRHYISNRAMDYLEHRGAECWKGTEDFIPGCPLSDLISPPLFSFAYEGIIFQVTVINHPRQGFSQTHFHTQSSHNQILSQCWSHERQRNNFPFPDCNVLSLTGKIVLKLAFQVLFWNCKNMFLK